MTRKKGTEAKILFGKFVCEFTLFTSYRVDPGGPVVNILATGSEVRGFKPGRGRWIISERKNPEYDFLRKENKIRGSRVVDLQPVKESQSEIRASEQNLSDF